ncbi:hypothetical protein Tco_0780614 [Tanacetum coccineum]
MAALKFASSHNMVAFLDKPTESDGFEQIQFWATTKVNTINGEVKIQAVVDKKKVIITETSIRRDLQLADENGTECLPNATIFVELERMGTNLVALWPLLSSVLPQTKDLTFQEKQKPRKSKKQNIEVSQPSDSTEPIADEAPNDESVPTHSNDPLLSGEERLKLNELMELYTNLSQRVLDLENTKTSQAAEITKLKERVKKLERRNKSRTPGLKRLRKVGRTARIESSEDEGLGDQEDASKQGRKITGCFRTLTEKTWKHSGKSEVWRNLQGYNVTVWKLFSSSGVHFVRFQNLHIFMLVEKKYPLTPATITKMLNKKLQTDHWNEMCYQLLKLMTKQLKNPGSGRIVGIKRLHDDLGVNTAKVRVTAAKHNLVIVGYEYSMTWLGLATCLVVGSWWVKSTRILAGQHRVVLAAMAVRMPF